MVMMNLRNKLTLFMQPLSPDYVWPCINITCPAKGLEKGRVAFGRYADPRPRSRRVRCRQEKRTPSPRRRKLQSGAILAGGCARGYRPDKRQYRQARTLGSRILTPAAGGVLTTPNAAASDRIQRSTHRPHPAINPSTTKLRQQCGPAPPLASSSVVSAPGTGLDPRRAALASHRRGRRALPAPEPRTHRLPFAPTPRSRGSHISAPSVWRKASA